MSDSGSTSSTSPTKPATKEAPAKSAADEATAAQEKADAEAAELAEERLAPTDNQMTYAEYDAVGKGKDYEPSPETQAHNEKADAAVEEAANPSEPAPHI